MVQSRIRKILYYIENIWIGADGKPSLRSLLAIAFSIDFIRNLSHAIYKWDVGRSLEGLSLVLGIEAGLIISLLGLTAWNNIANKKIENDYGIIQPVKVEKADTIVVTKEKVDI